MKGAWGLGELVVQGDVRPDRYIVDKRGMRILERVVNHKDYALVRSHSGENQRVLLDEARANERVLSDDEIRTLAELAVCDEAHYGAPQDAEWAIMGEQLFFVQTRPVIYRTMDFRTNEFRGLEGGGTFEPEEANPMIGYRGCYRYVLEPDLFNLELRAIAQVRQQFSTLHVMIPFVRTRGEFARCKEIIDQSGLTRTSDMELWVMAEVPSVACWIPEYAALGATGVSIGSSDLTQLMLGVDRDSQVLAPLYNERDAAVLDAIHRIVEAAHSAGMTCSICGQAPSVYPDYAERLVRWGIDSISVTSDAIEQTRRNIAVAEQRILLEGARRITQPPRTAEPARAATPHGHSLHPSVVGVSSLAPGMTPGMTPVLEAASESATGTPVLVGANGRAS